MAHLQQDLLLFSVFVITDPLDKNSSVKKSIANVARIIISNHKDPLSITKTNLQDFLIK